MLEIRWRPRAQLDRTSIALYLGQECGNPQAAAKTIAAIDEAVSTVANVPDIGGHFFQEGLLREYRYTTAGNYYVFYRHDQEILTIFRIIHQRRDLDTYTLTKF